MKKLKIERLTFQVPDESFIDMFIIKHKPHWYGRWEYVMDNGVPQLFCKEYIERIVGKSLN